MATNINELCHTRIALTTQIWARWALLLNTKCWRIYEHKLLEVFTNTNFSNNTNEPCGLFSLRFLLNLYSLDLRYSCSFSKTKSYSCSFLSYELLAVLRTRIFRITRIEPCGLFSMRYLLNLYSLDSRYSCSFQRPRVIRVPFWATNCLRFYEHEFFE